MTSIWRDQWFVLKQGGEIVGFEHDQARIDDGYQVRDEPALGAWSFSSALTLPLARMEVRATCRSDWPLSPVEVSWSSPSNGPQIDFRFDDPTHVRLFVTNALGDKLPEKTVQLDTDPRQVCLEINASRLVERAALVERPVLRLQLFRCDYPPDGKTREYTVRLEGREVLVWDSERLPVLKYVEACAPPETRDEYYVSKERGLMAGRIRGYDLIRLHGAPRSGVAPATGK